jgi:hypothetical protein
MTPLQALYCCYKLKNEMVTIEVPLSLHIEELNESNWHEKIKLLFMLNCFLIYVMDHIAIY